MTINKHVLLRTRTFVKIYPPHCIDIDNLHWIADRSNGSVEYTDNRQTLKGQTIWYQKHPELV